LKSLFYTLHYYCTIAKYCLRHPVLIFDQRKKVHLVSLENLHCKKSVLKIQEYIHEGANLKFYIPEFFNFKLLIPEYSPICRFWFQTAAYFFLQCRLKLYGSRNRTMLPQQVSLTLDCLVSPNRGKKSLALLSQLIRT
jgi:hypothetical protein